ETEMKSYAPPPFLPLDRPAPPQPQNRWCERGANVHRRHPTGKHFQPRHGLVAVQSRNKVLCNVEQPCRRPGEPEPGVPAHHKRPFPSFPGTGAGAKRALTNRTIAVTKRIDLGKMPVRHPAAPPGQKIVSRYRRTAHNPAMQPHKLIAAALAAAA